MKKDRKNTSTSQNQKVLTLTKAEEKIMQILWEIEKGFIKDILEKYDNPKPPYNSVSTIVRVLVKKEIVGFKSYGGSHQYYPLINKSEYSKNQLSKLVKDYYNNSFKQIVNFFSESEKLNNEEVDEVIQMLEELKKKKNNE